MTHLPWWNDFRRTSSMHAWSLVTIIVFWVWKLGIFRFTSERFNFLTSDYHNYLLSRWVVCWGLLLSYNFILDKFTCLGLYVILHSPYVWGEGLVGMCASISPQTNVEILRLWIVFNFFVGNNTHLKCCPSSYDHLTIYLMAARFMCLDGRQHA